MCSARQVLTIAQAQHAEHGEERDRVAAHRREADRRADVDDREPDRAVEHAPGAVRPRLEIAAPLAPDEEEEERDREQECDPEQPADRRQHRLEREHDDDERDQGHDREPAHGPVLVEAPHDPVMVPRTPRAAATSAEHGEPEQAPPGVGRGVEPRREDDAERDAAVDVVQVVGGPVAAREQQQPERGLGDEQRLGQREQVDRGAADLAAAAVRDEADDTGEQAPGDDDVGEIAVGVDHPASLPSGDENLLNAWERLRRSARLI